MWAILHAVAQGLGWIDFAWLYPPNRPLLWEGLKIGPASPDGGNWRRGIRSTSPHFRPLGEAAGAAMGPA